MPILLHKESSIQQTLFCSTITSRSVPSFKLYLPFIIEMDTNVWNRFSALRCWSSDSVVNRMRYYVSICTWSHTVVNWIRYYVCICPSAAFISSLVACYHLAQYVVVGVLTTYITDTLDSPVGRSDMLLIAATLNKVHGGLTAIFEVILIFTSDSHIGGFKTVLFSSASYITGLTMLVFWERTPYSERLVLNTIAIFYLAIGCGGKAILRKFLSEQLRAKEPTREPIDEDRVVARTRIWYRSSWLIAAVVSIFGDFDTWSKLFAYLASAMVFSYLVFSCGICFYHRKNHPDHQENPVLLTKGNVEDTETSTGTIKKTSSFRQTMQHCKSKPVIMFMLPTWGFAIVFGIGVSTADTFFQMQADDLKFPFDITALLLLAAISGRGISFLYDFILSKCQPADGETTRRGEMMRSWIKIWIGMLLMVACLLVGWRIEAYRHTSECKDNKIPHLALKLALQFLLLGPAKTFAEDGLNNLLDYHLPDSLKKYGASLNGFATGGLGNFLGIVLLQVLRHWFPFDLESSRLDKYYLLVAILNFLNLSPSILWILYKGMDGFAVVEAVVDVEEPTAVEEPTESLAIVSMEMAPVKKNYI